jgi:hypothetical protein
MDAHAREYAGAVAGINEVYNPQPGDYVRLCTPFVQSRHVGLVKEVTHRDVLVEVDGEILAYYPRELAFAGRTL